MAHSSRIGARLAHLAIRAYQLSVSALIGSRCRHLPTCSAYMDEAIDRHGLWAGGCMGLARLCRCQPFGTAGYDPVPAEVPPRARWWRPWAYGRWSGPLPVPWCDATDAGRRVTPEDGTAPESGPLRRHSRH